ncbi:hypothetical protein K2173_002839 [Erythroxylum novogranatense]|uniref:Cytochrome P450 n=1 Tax=Erythroxylum novogranatense TaxID=1862640 RepID=A0AAV8SQQ3_9ROSI|nr:hypothetical protein K2173_002839 [Erythroxylum novogranatense]
MELLHIFLLFLPLLLLLKPFLWRRTTTNLPPGPRGLPILGSLLQLGPRPNQSLYHLAKIYGPLMSLRLGSITTVVASSPETAKELLHSHDQTFSDRTVPDAVFSQPNPEGTVAWIPGNRQWKNRRRICSTQMFTEQRLNSQQNLRHQKVQQLVEHLRKRSAQGIPVDIGPVAFATALNLISTTIFSIDMVDPEFEKAQEFQDVVWTIMEGAGKPNLSDYFPILKRFDLQGVRKHIRPAYQRLHEIFDEIIDERLASKARLGDFLDVLINQDGPDSDRKLIKPLIVDLFIAGSDTSSSTTEWAMSELLKNPDVLHKARKELLEVIGPEGTVKESDVDKLPYLQAIAKETLRLHPSAPLLLPYKASNDVKVQTGYTIPKGSQVLVNAWGIGRDPKYWDDPLSFRPERFMTSSSKDYKGHDFEYIPFGAGRRICPGAPLAVRMVHLMVGSMIHSFDWELVDGMSPENLDMEEQFGITLKKAIPLRAIPISLRK